MTSCIPATLRERARLRPDDTAFTFVNYEQDNSGSDGASESLTWSQLYRRALGEFVSRHAAEPVTRAMNEVVDAVGADTDEFGAEASRRMLKRVEW